MHSKNQKARLPGSLWVFAILGAATFLPEMISSDWSPFRLSDDLNASPGLAGMGFVAFTSGMVIGRMSGDWVSAKLGLHRLLNYAVVVAVIGLSIAFLIDNIAAVFIGLSFAALGISVLFPALYDAAAQDSGGPGVALGAMTAGTRGSMLVAPLVIGMLADSGLFSVGMAMAVIALPCLLVIGLLSPKTSN